MTDTTVAPPETSIDDQDAALAPEAESVVAAPASPLAAPEAIAVAVPPPPGPGNPSPDDTTLAFLQSDPDGAPRLWLQSLDESGDATPRPVDLPFTPLIERDQSGDSSGDEGPQWSPDGAWLALTGATEAGGQTGIWRVKIATWEAQSLTDHPAADRGPRWSPDGQLIAFTSLRNGRDTVCLVAAEGGPVQQLTDGLQDDRDPAWSRDGAQLAFRRAVAGHPTHHDIWVLTLASGELKQVTNVPGRANSKAANRRAPKWAPNRSLIAFVTDEKEWDGIAVVNPDNLSGWTLADEPGDKREVRWSPNGLRILYTRTRGTLTHCCAKGTSAAKPDILDTEDGVARAPRWLGDAKAVYLHTSPTTPWRFIVQEAKTESARRELPSVAPWAGPAEGLPTPQPHEVEVGDGAKIGGLLYRPTAAHAPAVVVLGDGPPVRQEAVLDVVRSSLAAAGSVVFAPNLRGATGAGRAFTNRLAELVDQEIETADLTDVAVALRGAEGIDGERIAIAGRGFGGTLALLAASSRPGHYAAVVAVDPILDWDREIDTASGSWRSWIIGTFGLPGLHGGRYALRTPATFAPLLDVPLLLVGTPATSRVRVAQLDEFAAILDELGVGYERADAANADAEVARLAVDFLRRVLAPAAAPIADDAASSDLPSDDGPAAKTPAEPVAVEVAQADAPDPNVVRDEA